MARLTPPPGSARTRRRRGSLGARLLLLGCSTLVALGLAELTVRILAPRPTNAVGHFFAADPDLTYTLAPDHEGRFSDDCDFDTRVRTNGEGLRGPAFRADRPGLLGVGDSFLFGYGVEEDETFLTLAARATGLEPWNAGAPGYDVGRAGRLGMRLLERLGPRAVVLSIFLGNDERDSAPGHIQVEVEGGALVDPGPPRSWLRRVTHALYVRLQLVRLLVQMGGNAAAVRPILAPFLDPPDAEIVAGDPVIRDAVRALAAACRRARVPLVVVLIPEKLEVVEGEAERIAAAAGLRGAALDSRRSPPPRAGRPGRRGSAGGGRPPGAPRPRA